MEIRQLQPQVAAVKRAVCEISDLPAVIDASFPALLGELASKNVEITGPAFVRYLRTGEDEAGSRDIRREPSARRMEARSLEVELGIPIAPDTSPATRSIVLPGGQTAVYLYVGPYDGLRSAWEQFGEWVERQGLKQSGPFWESYVSDPRTTDPSERITELYMPVE